MDDLVKSDDTAAPDEQAVRRFAWRRWLLSTIVPKSRLGTRCLSASRAGSQFNGGKMSLAENPNQNKPRLSLGSMRLNSAKGGEKIPN